jgi:hypothetical protein
MLVPATTNRLFRLGPHVVGVMVRRSCEGKRAISLSNRAIHGYTGESSRSALSPISQPSTSGVLGGVRPSSGAATSETADASVKGSSKGPSKGPLMRMYYCACAREVVRLSGLGHKSGDVS